MNHQETEEEFLIDMLEYYSPDPFTRRCTDPFDNCTYSPEKADKVGKSEGCGIGRRMERANAIELDKYGPTDVENAIKTRPDLFSDSIKNLNIKFLLKVQSLHDCWHHWGAKGLSIEGLVAVKNIIYDYNLKIDKKSLIKYADPSVDVDLFYINY